MNRQFPALRHALKMFAIHVGLSFEQSRAQLSEELESEAWREQLGRELRAALGDPSAPWQELVANDDYEVDDVESQREAAEVVVDLLWDAVFPGEPAPELKLAMG